MKRIFILLLLVILSSGCASQLYGVSHYELNKDGTFIVKSGKETGSVEAVMSRKGEDQFVYFKATDVRAFEGQKIGAEVASEVTKAVREVLPQIVSQAVRAALGTKALESLGGALTSGAAEGLLD
ncbi:MAG: hypothetical protein FVQ79_00610 [Planctomycetes bacterium]|nr:hypothetical protein [Planctomycetota bacterium]